MTDERRIWEALTAMIGNAYGAAGLMGNLYAESALRPDNLQNSYEKRLGMTDATYTEAVDQGVYPDFCTDRAGYGLAQWTSEKRKTKLLAFARERGTSIADLDMQLLFLQAELTGAYRSVLEGLMYAQSVRDASDLVLRFYENPADQSEAVQIKRAGYGATFLNKFGQIVPHAVDGLKRGDRGEAVKELQRLLNDLGEGLDVDGIFGAKTEAALIDFQKDAGMDPNGIAGDAVLDALRKAAHTDAQELIGGGTGKATAEKLRAIAAKLVQMADEMEAEKK